MTLSEYYEIVIFTAAMKDYADWIIEGIDQCGIVSHRLYRQHCVQVSSSEIMGRSERIEKDLRLLGRDIKKTIIIDNLLANFIDTCPLNGIEIESWYGDDPNFTDIELLKLIPFL